MNQELTQVPRRAKKPIVELLLHLEIRNKLSK
jgi:hypothetical protein